MASTDTIFQRSKLLNKYYEKTGKAAAGIGACPVFTEFRAGYGLVDTSDPDNPVLLTIPANMAEIPNEFYRGLVEAEYSNGVTQCKCEIPIGAVDKPRKFNMIGIFDQDSDLVAVCTTFPDWVTPTEVDRSYPALTFPLEEEDEDASSGTAEDSSGE
ncbi:MAG: hypothetical protein IJU76_14240 [Desulfovibrionaceae bacterium]|nr:hypothetical protein [Desulfovibrionaceae bacterium]